MKFGMEREAKAATPLQTSGMLILEKPQCVTVIKVHSDVLMGEKQSHSHTAEARREETKGDTSGQPTFTVWNPASIPYMK